MKTLITIKWAGPFGWPKFEDDLPPIPNYPGVYLMTVKHKNGYLIQGVGVTSRPIRKRFQEHASKYLTGVYNVLDIEKMKKGERKEVWHGFWMGKSRSTEKQKEFKKRKDKITIAVCRLFAGYRIFTANVTNKRIGERLEAAIMDSLDKPENPFHKIPDEGVHLVRRRPEEGPIAVNNKCSVKLLGLPRVFDI